MRLDILRRNVNTSGPQAARISRRWTIFLVHMDLQIGAPIATTKLEARS